MTFNRSSELPGLLVDDGACINVRGRAHVCAACRDACAARALTLSLDGVALDPGRCTACGACAAKCPAGAIGLRTFSPQEFVLSLGGQPAVHIHCSASADGAAGIDNGVVIACHNVLDARLLAAASAAGTGSFQLHGLGQCGPCPKGSAVAQVALIQTTLQIWFEHAAPQVQAVAESRNEAQAQRWHAARLSRSRRGFLCGAGLRASVVATTRQPSGAGAHAYESGSSPVNLEHGHAASYQAVLREHAADLPWRQLPWRKRSISEACTACMACVQRCPTGALTAPAEPAAHRIDFELGLCTDCRLCEQICPQQAIVAQPAAQVGDVVSGRVTLLSRALQHCASCRRHYVAGAGASELCSVCNKERALKGEWLGLLGGGRNCRDVAAS